MGVVVQADKQVISFQERYYRDEMVRRARILDEAADRGIFLEEDAAAISTTSN